MKSVLRIITVVFGLAFVMSSFNANAFYGEGTSNVIDLSGGGSYCEANFELDEGNHVIYSIEPISIRISQNKNFVHATCKFIDRSGVSADRAESLSKAACEITDAEGNVYEGAGRAVAANNETIGEPCGPDECVWGNVTITCKAPVE